MAGLAQGQARTTDLPQEVIAPLDLSGPRPKIKDPVATFGRGDTVELLRSDGYLDAGAQGKVIWAGVKDTCWEGMYRVLWDDDTTSRHYARELRLIQCRTADFDSLGVTSDGKMSTYVRGDLVNKYVDGKYDPVTGEAVVA